MVLKAESIIVQIVLGCIGFVCCSYTLYVFLAFVFSTSWKINNNRNKASRVWAAAEEEQRRREKHKLLCKKRPSISSSTPSSPMDETTYRSTSTVTPPSPHVSSFENFAYYSASSASDRLVARFNKQYKYVKLHALILFLTTLFLFLVCILCLCFVAFDF